jgi:DNA-directed RNA polymerase subunit M/transcription elongation factor TFIIS
MGSEFYIYNGKVIEVHECDLDCVEAHLTCDICKKNFATYEVITDEDENVKILYVCEKCRRKKLLGIILG